jgi:phosphohistidine phosphatase SixA
MKLYLMRHCLTDEGARDDPNRTLDDTGRAQAKVIKKFLKLAEVNPDLVISSDYARAHDTAKVVNRGVEIVTTSALEPDSTVAKAWKAILKLAGDAKSVLVVTHGPLIQPLLASVAFCFDPQFNWEHGAVAYVNTHESRFRWFVTPKLAAHIVGEDPVDVENPDQFAKECLQLAENLLVAHKAAVIDPLVATMKRALATRWKRQRVRLLKAMPGLKSAIELGDVTVVARTLHAMLPLPDESFGKAYRAVRSKAYGFGIEHVHAQLGEPLTEAEAPKKKLPAAIQEPPDDTEDYESGIDNTTGDRLKTTLSAVKPFEYAGVLAAVRGMFKDFTAPGDGSVPRAETAALDVVSGAYHDGGAAVATHVADTTGQQVEKRWEAEDDACEVCLENEGEDWIPDDSPHGSGDYEPPAHPNCRCSESYRIAGE